jgi:acetoin utilization deacetylase AcuC-like enzyme
MSGVAWMRPMGGIVAFPASCIADRIATCLPSLRSFRAPHPHNRVFTAGRPAQRPSRSQSPPTTAAALPHAVAAAALPHAVVYHEDFKINPIPDGHRFPMPKDALLYQRLVELGLATRTFTPVPPDPATLCLVHAPSYVNSFLDGTIDPGAMRRIGLPWSPELVRRTLIGVGAHILAARLALQFGVAVTTNGGTHHAHRSYGAGWCIFNDQAVAAAAARRDCGVERILFVDLDVHQGDGTATIFADDPSVFTLSLHGEQQSFPSHLTASDLDVPLPAGCSDAEYLAALQNVLPSVINDFKPELVMYNAGADVAADDSLGTMAMTNDGILARDRFVMKTCAAVGVPVAAGIGGGYEPDHVRLVERHVGVHRAAAETAGEMMARCTAMGRKAAAAATAAREGAKL